MTVSVFPSGGYPDACKDGHPWKGPRKAVLLGWTGCGCRGGLGHNWVRCQHPGCRWVFYDPPHRPDAGLTLGAPPAPLGQCRAKARSAPPFLGHCGPRYEKL